MSLYKNIVACERGMIGKSVISQSVGALMLPAYRHRFQGLARELNSDELREFEKLMVEFHMGREG